MSLADRVSEALRQRSPELLTDAFRWLVVVESADPSPDERDAMVDMVPFIDCARRLGEDPATLLGPIAATGALWYWQTFDVMVRRTDVSLAAFAWQLDATASGPTYRFDSCPGVGSRPN